MRREQGLGFSSGYRGGNLGRKRGTQGPLLYALKITNCVRITVPFIKNIDLPLAKICDFVNLCDSGSTQ